MSDKILTNYKRNRRIRYSIGILVGLSMPIILRLIFSGDTTGYECFRYFRYLRTHYYGCAGHCFCAAIIVVTTEFGISTLFGFIGLILNFTKLFDSKFEKTISIIYNLFVFLPIITILIALPYCSDGYDNWRSGLGAGFWITLCFAIILPILICVLKRKRYKGIQGDGGVVT